MREAATWYSYRCETHAAQVIDRRLGEVDGLRLSANGCLTLMAGWQVVDG
jgi:hypothetical protein